MLVRVQPWRPLTPSREIGKPNSFGDCHRHAKSRLTGRLSDGAHPLIKQDYFMTDCNYTIGEFLEKHGIIPAFKHCALCSLKFECYDNGNSKSPTMQTEYCNLDSLKNFRVTSHES